MPLSGRECGGDRDSGASAGAWRTRRSGTQTTLRNRATVSGVGVHSGHAVSMTLHPAEADSGIYFYRTNLDDGRDREIPADYRYVSATDLCTTVGRSGASVATIEHLMATLRGARHRQLHDRDRRAGSAGDGRQRRRLHRCDRPGRHRDALGAAPLHQGREAGPGRGRQVASPSSARTTAAAIEVEIDFANPLIGRQPFAADVDRRHASAATSPGRAPSASSPT